MHELRTLKRRDEVYGPLINCQNLTTCADTVNKMGDRRVLFHSASLWASEEAFAPSSLRIRLPHDMGAIGYFLLHLPKP